MPTNYATAGAVRRTLGLAFCYVLAAAAVLLADDWPQYRGTNRSGATGEKIATTWPATQPAELWRAEVGKGHSPVSVAGGRAYTLGYTGRGDTVWCLDANTGQEIWRHDYPSAPHLKGEPGGGAFDGPHAAPAVHRDRVYTLSRNGQVHCLGAAKGEDAYSLDSSSYHGSWSLWQFDLKPSSAVWTQVRLYVTGGPSRPL